LLQLYFGTFKPFLKFKITEVVDFKQHIYKYDQENYPTA